MLVSKLLAEFDTLKKDLTNNIQDLVKKLTKESNVSQSPEVKVSQWLINNTQQSPASSQSNSQSQSNLESSTNKIDSSELASSVSNTYLTDISLEVVLKYHNTLFSL